MSEENPDEVSSRKDSIGSNYGNRDKPKVLSDDELADEARMKRIGMWVAGIAVVLALVLGIGPILNGNSNVRDSGWHVVEVVASNDPLVADVISDGAGTPREIEVGDWTWQVRRGMVQANAIRGEFSGTEERIKAGAVPVALIEIDGWIIVANNGGSTSGQISSTRERSVTFIDSDSRLVAETISVAKDNRTTKADFLSLFEVDGSLWVYSKLDQRVTIIDPN